MPYNWSSLLCCSPPFRVELNLSSCFNLNACFETSLPVQWLRFYTSTAVVTGLIPNLGTEILHDSWGEKKACFGRILHLWYPVLFQFSSVAQSCLTLCHPTDCSMPGLHVHHQYPELAQTHVHQVSDVIQLSHLLSSPSPLIFNLSQ